MIQKTRLFRPSLLAALFGVASAASLLAQGPGGGGHEPHHGPPPNALFDALDTNHDGVISADEITNAPSSLKAMLKNGATELKREDVRPPHPGPMQAAPDSEDRPRPKPPESRSAGATDPAASSTDAPKADAPFQGQERHPHHGPPPNALFDVLDANHDGVISSGEMDNAPTAIKTLLKNGATQIKREDLRPPRPPQGQEN